MYDMGGLFSYGVLALRFDCDRLWVALLHFVHEGQCDFYLQEVNGAMGVV